MGKGNEGQYLVGEAMFKEGCKNIIATGDIIYEDGVSSPDDPQWKTKFEAPYKSLIESGAVFYIALGNHDYRGSILAQLEYAASNNFYFLPNRYYLTQIEDVCLMTIDTGQILLGSSQKKWIKKNLKKLSKCSWRFVSGHHAVRSSGKHGDTLHVFKSFLKPLLAKHTDLYLSGHDHNLADEGFIKQKNKKKRKFRQIVSGAGASVKKVKCRKKKCQFAISSLGFVKLTTSPELMKIEFINEKNELLYEATQEPKSLL